MSQEPEKENVFFEVVCAQLESSSELPNVRAFGLSTVTEPRLYSQAAENTMQGLARMGWLPSSLGFLQ